MCGQKQVKYHFCLLPLNLNQYANDYPVYITGTYLLVDQDNSTTVRLKRNQNTKYSKKQWIARIPIDISIVSQWYLENTGSAFDKVCKWYLIKLFFH